MNVLEPLTIKWSPSLTAVVLIACTSEPPNGSVMAKQPTFSPLIPGTKYFCFCASVPSAFKWVNANSGCAPIEAPKPPEFIRPISSSKMTLYIMSPSIPPYASGKVIPKKPISPNFL